MEALISHIMQRAGGIKRPAEDMPLDLTLPKLLRHICDSFIDHTDLRPGSDSKTDLDNDSCSVQRAKGQSYSTSNVIPARKALDFGLTGTCSKKSTPRPFSIEALLGDTNASKYIDPSTPAIVYNYHSARISSTTNEDTLNNYDQIVSTSYWCHACNSFCTDNTDAQGHQYLHYMQGVKCDLKKDLLRKHGYVTKHITINNENVQCGLCDKMIALCFFSEHQRLHCKHSCDICDKEFPSSIHLLDHMNVHTGNTSFSCKTCDRKFAKRSSLTQHQRYHRDNQRFKCTYCYKSFNSKYTRTVHERLHTGEKPFKCQEPGCMKAFPQKIQLQLHMNTHMN